MVPPEDFYFLNKIRGMVSFWEWVERKKGVWGDFNFEIAIIGNWRESWLEKYTVNLLDTI